MSGQFPANVRTCPDDVLERTKTVYGVANDVSDWANDVSDWANDVSDWASDVSDRASDVSDRASERKRYRKRKR